jgi:hypothetical protein
MYYTVVSSQWMSGREVDSVSSRFERVGRDQFEGLIRELSFLIEDQGIDQKIERHGDCVTFRRGVGEATEFVDVFQFHPEPKSGKRASLEMRESTDFVHFPGIEFQVQEVEGGGRFALLINGRFEESKELRSELESMMFEIAERGV